MNKIIYYIIFSFLIISCNDDDSTNKSPIVGNWKLSQAKIYVTTKTGEIKLETIDYSSKNIKYEFKQNNNLIVTGVDSENLSYSNGNYKYEFKTDYVEIEQLKWNSTYSQSTLILDQTYVDGPQLILTRQN